jgi:hypothetical protein
MRPSRETALKESEDRWEVYLVYMKKPDLSEEVKDIDSGSGGPSISAAQAVYWASGWSP